MNVINAAYCPVCYMPGYMTIKFKMNTTMQWKIKLKIQLTSNYRFIFDETFKFISHISINQLQFSVNYTILVGYEDKTIRNTIIFDEISTQVKQ